MLNDEFYFYMRMAQYVIPALLTVILLTIPGLLFIIRKLRKGGMR